MLFLSFLGIKVGKCWVYWNVGFMGFKLVYIFLFFLVVVFLVYGFIKGLSIVIFVVCVLIKELVIEKYV